MWWIWLQTTGNNFSVVFRNWDVPPQNGKKTHVVPVFQDKNKQELKNYRPISLLYVSDKIFERLLYDTMFKFFTENSLISQNQSGFNPEEFCTTITFIIFWDILMFYQISFHHKWNVAGLLLTNKVYTSGLMSCQTT